MILVAQLSDTHIVVPGRLLYRQIDTAAALRAAVARILALRPLPDCVVLSGDLVDRGRADEYAQLTALLAPLPMPVYPLPGNHDSRRALHAAFAGRAVDANDDGLAGDARDAGDVNDAWRTGSANEAGLAGEAAADDALLNRRIDLGPLSLLLLDTLVPGEEGGEFGAAHLAWLEAACPAAGPVLLFMHHPPFPTGIAGMDALACRGGERLAAWLARHANVVALACGHVHRAVFTRFAGIPAMIAPGPAHQIALDLGGDAAALAWTPEPGGFLLHRWDGEALVTHVVPVASAASVRYAVLPSV